jgi:hypothetical protein
MDRKAYVDLASFVATDFGSKHALAPIGEPAVGALPSDRGTTRTLAMAINRMHGVIAPFVFKGHGNTLIVAIYFNKVLLPACAALGIDEVIVDRASYWECAL